MRCGLPGFELFGDGDPHFLFKDIAIKFVLDGIELFDDRRVESCSWIQIA